MACIENVVQKEIGFAPKKETIASGMPSNIGPKIGVKARNESWLAFCEALNNLSRAMRIDIRIFPYYHLRGRLRVKAISFMHVKIRKLWPR